MNKTVLALQDLWKGLVSWRIWLLLAWQDIKLRYRRSQLGPFWITLSMGITIFSMGFLYSHLFKMQLANYFPYLAGGMISWAFISTVTTECTNAFIEAEGYLKQISIPYSVFVLRIITRNLIVFLHNVLVIIPIIIYFHIAISWHSLVIIFDLLLLAVIAFVYGLLLAVLGSRFRDIAQIIVSLIQVAFFVTPVMWNPSSLSSNYSFIIGFNPFAQFVDLIRAPLLGQLPDSHALIVSIGLAVVGAIFTFMIFARYRKRIIYWL